MKIRLVRNFDKPTNSERASPFCSFPPCIIASLLAPPDTETVVHIQLRLFIEKGMLVGPSNALLERCEAHGSDGLLVCSRRQQHALRSFHLFCTTLTQNTHTHLCLFVVVIVVFYFFFFCFFFFFSSSPFAFLFVCLKTREASFPS